MNLNLKFYPDPILRSKCEKVTRFSAECLSLIKQMKHALTSLPGLALAAPQVGFPERIIVLNMRKIREKKEMLVLINPVIKDSAGKIKREEGCLSIPNIFEDIVRPDKIAVEGMDLNGEEVFFDADDILARVIQHEIDHLDGVLFWDHLSERKKNKLKRKYQEIIDENYFHGDTGLCRADVSGVDEIQA